MALNFPSPALQGDTYTASNNVVYVYDGVKWSGDVAGTTGVTFDQSLNTTNNVTFSMISGLSSNGELSIRGPSLGESSAYLSLPSDDNAASWTARLGNDNGNVELAAMTQGAGSASWKFKSDATLELPNYVKQVTTGSVTCPANADTIIYTGTDSWQHTFKLLLKIEGTEGSETNWDTQTCEMSIAKGYRSNAVAGSVYGLVYTSNGPLATFSTRWNTSINKVEVLCRPTSTTSYVVVRSFVTEMTSSD